MASGTIKDTNIYMDSVDTPQYTAAANGGRAHGNLYTLINNKMPQGCRCLGIVGVSSGSGSMLSISAKYVNSDYSWDLRNVSNAQVTTNASYAFLYQKI